MSNFKAGDKVRIVNFEHKELVGSMRNETGIEWLKNHNDELVIDTEAEEGQVDFLNTLSAMRGIKLISVEISSIKTEDNREENCKFFVVPEEILELRE